MSLSLLLSGTYRRSVITAAVIASLVTTADSRQDTVRLTLPECIRLARTHGPQGGIARLSFDSKRFRYDAFTATYLPQLSLQGDLPGYYRSITPVVFPDGSTIFTPQSQASSSVNLILSQKIPFTGADLSLESGLNRIDLLETNSQYYRSNPLTVRLRQPLFQINTMKWDREMEETRYLMAWRERAEAMEEIAIDITNRFFDVYLSSMNARDAAINLANNDTLYNISRGRYNVGRIAENDLLQSELAYLNAQTQLENATLEYERAHAALKIALGLPVTSAIALSHPPDIPLVVVDSALAVAEAFRNRSDMLGFELQRLAADRDVDQARSDNLFNATMSASVGFNQRAPLLNDAYRNLLDQQQFTIRLDVPLFRWGAGSAAIDGAVARRDQARISVEEQRSAFRQEVLDQVARLNLLRRQAQVSAKADTVASRRFDVAKDRYLIGKIDIPNLFLAQEEKDNARRSHIQTLRNYWTAYFRVRRLTLYDFVEGESLFGDR